MPGHVSLRISKPNTSKVGLRVKLSTECHAGSDLIFIQLRFFANLCLLILEKLIEITGYHTVIKLSYLVSPFAIEAFKRGMRGYDINLPGSKRTEMLTYITVKPLCLTERSKPFTVGGICHDCATHTARGYLAAIKLHSLDTSIYTRRSCVSFCQADARS